jgi:antitoxin HigA-1
VIRSFRHKGLRDLFLTGRSARVRPDLRKRCLARLDALHAATELSQLDLPGFRLHPLKGEQSGHWAVAVNVRGGSPSNGARMAMRTESTSNSTIEHEEYSVTERPARCPTHPGELLREIITESLSLPVAEAARQLGVSRMTLHRILRGEQAVTPEMALRLGKLCGNGPELWLRMQMARDLWRLERSMRADLARIPTHRAA